MRAFHPLWNPEMAVRVLGHLQGKGIDATLAMAGQDRGSESRIRRLVETQGLAGVVRFPGFLGMSQKVAEGGSADIFLNTNRVDNMPVAVVEACAMGLVVVSTRVGGIPDMLVDGDNGLLVDDDDDLAMADAVIRVLGDQALAGQISANARKLAERSAWADVYLLWRQLFSDLGAAGPRVLCAIAAVLTTLCATSAM
jgi:glycosyltransferase involved in cell wall biosynthesis